MRWNRRAFAPHACLLMVQVASLAWIGWRAPLSGGFPLDDAWIHQVAARNLASLGSLGVVPGRFGSGTTSLLWVALLAPNEALLHWPPQAWAALLGTTLHLVAGQTILLAARRDGLDRAWSFVFAAMFSVSPNAAWFALSGMETTLATALLVAACLVWFAPHPTGRSAAGCGLLLGLLVSTRPESVILCVALVALAPRARRPVAHAAVALAAPALAGVAQLAANLWVRGQALPSTLAGRRWLWMQGTEHWPWYEPRLELLARWADRLWRYTLGEPWWALFWILVGLALVGASWCWRHAPRTGALVALLGAQLATYLALLPSEGHGGRYQPLVASLFLPLACLGGRCSLHALALRARAPDRVAGALAWLVPAAMVPGLLAAHATWSKAHAAAVRHVLATEVAAGQWIGRLPPGARVASYDIGAISYFSGGHAILDLGGLSEPAVFDEVLAGRLSELLAQQRIEYLVMPMPYGDDPLAPAAFLPRLGLVRNDRPRLVPVAEFSSPLEVWLPGLLATYHCLPRQVVYRVGRAPESAP